MTGWMWRAVRWVLRYPPPRVGSEDARRLAEEEARRRDAWVGKVVVYEGLKYWEVWINADFKSSAYVQIDNQTGRVVKWAELPM